MSKLNFDVDVGPTWGLEGAELALWKCYALTGEDVSGGPFAGWYESAVSEVAAVREALDLAVERIEGLAGKVDAALRDLDDLL